MKRFLVPLLLLSSTATAQTTELQGEALLRALLEELRLLRTTIQRNAGLEIRSRVLLERARMHQEIVRDLQREVDQRSMETEFRMEMEPFEEMLANAEERLRDATDAESRRQIEQEIAGLRKRREITMRHRQSLEARHRRMEERLAEETDRLRGIEDELRRLEQAIAAEPR